MSGRGALPESRRLGVAAPEPAEAVLLRGHAGLAACADGSAGSAAAHAGRAADLGLQRHRRGHVAQLP